MVDMLISARKVPMDVSRPASKPAASTVAPSEDSPAVSRGNARIISTQRAQLSTLGGFKSALAEFRNAAATLHTLAKVLNLKPLFTHSLPNSHSVTPDSTVVQSADAASLLTATRKPAPAGSQNPVPRPALLLLNNSNLLDTDLPQSRPQAGSAPGATAGSPMTPASPAAALTQAIQTFVTAHNRLFTVLTQLADPGATPTRALPATTGDAATPKPGQAGVAQQPARPDSEPGQLSSHVASADLGKQARRLLDTLTMVTTRLPGVQAAGLTSGQDGELRLDAGRLQAAMVAQPRTITKLLNTMDLNLDEAQPSSSLPLRSSGATAAPSPLTTLHSALADFQEKARVVAGLARLLANPTPVAKPSPEPVITAPLLKPASGEIASVMPRPTLPAGAKTVETLHLNPGETLISTALARVGDRLAPLTLQFQIGRYDAVAQRFLADPQQAPVNVTLSDANETLPGLRDAIQAGNPDLGAAVVKDHAGYRLAMRLPGETIAHSIAVNISKAANPPATAEGQPLGFTVQRDADAVRNAVQSLVGAYNRLNSAAGSLNGNFDALAGPLRQSLAGTMANPERGRALAQAGVMVQRDGSLLIDPIRLSTAIAAHPQQVLDLFVEPEAGEEREHGLTTAPADSFNDWLSEIRDSKEPWDAQLDDQSPEEALNSEDGQHAEGGLLAVEMRYRARLETVNRLAQQLFSNELWLRQALERLAGGLENVGVVLGIENGSP